jgi:hypothetical protein
MGTCTRYDPGFKLIKSKEKVNKYDTNLVLFIKQYIIVIFRFYVVDTDTL